MAARQHDEGTGDPAPAGTPPASAGDPLDGGPAADDWEHAWLPRWLTEAGAQSEDGDVEDGDVEDGGPTVDPADATVATAEDDGPGHVAAADDGPGHVAAAEAVAADAVPDEPFPAVADRPPVVVGSIPPRVVVGPRVRPRRRRALATAVALLAAGGIAGAALLAGSGSEPVPTADVQAVPGTVAAPTRAFPPPRPPEPAGVLPAVPTATATLPVQPAWALVGDPAPVRAARPPAPVSMGEPAPAVAVPPLLPGSAAAAPTHQPARPVADPVPVAEPAPPRETPSTEVADPVEVPVPAPTTAATPTATPLPTVPPTPTATDSPTVTDDPTATPTETAAPTPTDGDVPDTEPPGTQEPAGQGVPAA
jgi:hypothetical protein